MSENVTVLSPRDSDLATFAASSEVASLPVANLQNMQPRKVWRSSATTAAISIAFASPVAADMLALVAHNLTDTGVIRVRGAALLADVEGSPDIDTGWQSAWPATGKPLAPSWPHHLSIVRWDAAGAFAYWLVDIADPSIELTYLQAGRLMLGESWQPTDNFDVSGVPLSFDFKDRKTVTDYGHTFTERRNAPRRMQLQFAAANKREVLDGLSEIQRLRGQWGDVALVLDPAETTDLHRFSMQCTFEGGTAPFPIPTAPEWDGDGIRFGANLNALEVL